MGGIWPPRFWVLVLLRRLPSLHGFPALPLLAMFGFSCNHCIAAGAGLHLLSFFMASPFQPWRQDAICRQTCLGLALFKFQLVLPLCWCFWSDVGGELLRGLSLPLALLPVSTAVVGWSGVFISGFILR
jgi:hypothetical protein